MGRHHTAGRAWAGPALAGLALAGSSLVGLAAAGHAAEPAPVPAVPCTSVAQACVDLAAGQAWLLENGVVIRGPVPVSSGAEGMETPTGAFRVEWKHLDHISGESGVPMPFSVFFAPGGIALHEGSTERESAGCVRMEREDARVFFDTLEVGDHVEVR
ncbi:MAG: L,D-transpeptidase [Pseudonocardia sp.]